MKVCKTIREFYGLSQYELAEYLQLSQAHLAMVEAGLRSIPTAALLKLNHLEIHRVDAAAAERITCHRLPEPHQEIFKQQLAKEIKKLQYKAQTLSLRLEAIKIAYAKAVQKKSLVNMPIAKNCSRAAADWFKKAQAMADDSIKDNHEGVQAILQSKIDALLLQVKSLTNII